DEETVTMLALWLLLRWERKVGLVALERIGVDSDTLARGVNGALVTAAEEAWQDGTRPRTVFLPSGRVAAVMDLNTALAPLLSAAEHEALALGHGYVGTEHLLLAIIQRAGPRLRGVLGAHEITHQRVRQSVLGVLSQ